MSILSRNWLSFIAAICLVILVWGHHFDSSTFFMYAETAAKDSLEQVISEALVQSGSDKSHVRGVCLGVSGVNHPSDQEMVESWIRWCK